MTEADMYTVYKGVYLPASLHPPHSLKHYEDFVFRPDDILIVTYPKSGESLSVLYLKNATLIVGLY